MKNNFSIIVANFCFFGIFFTGQFKLFPDFLNISYLIGLCFILILFLCFKLDKYYFSKSTFSLSIYLVLMFSFSLFNSRPLGYYYHFFLSLFAIITLNGIPFNSILQALKNYCNIIFIFALASLLNTFLFTACGICLPFLGNCNPDIFIFGFLELPRFSSFVVEPSAMVPFFLLPALFDIYLNGIKMRSIFVLIMLCFSFSGTLLMIFLLALFYIFFKRLFYNTWHSFLLFYLVIIPVLLIIFYSFLIYSYDREAISLFFTFGDNFSKSSSAIIRFEKLLEVLGDLVFLKNGTSNLYDMASGFFITSILTGGYITLFFSFLIYFQIIKNSFRVLNSNFNMLEKSIITILCSSFAIIFVFNDYGFTEYCGLLMLYIYIRIILKKSSFRRFDVALT